jgi:hypothetical protein
MQVKQKQGMSLIYAIIFGIAGLIIAALVVFPLNEAWVYIQAIGITTGADATTLGIMGDLIKFIPVAFVLAYVVGLFTTAWIQRTEV